MMKFTRVRRDKGWIKLDKWKNLSSQWYFRYSYSFGCFSSFGELGYFLPE
jgi:hypothetical protein